MTEGFVTAEEIYVLKPSTNLHWVPSLYKCEKEDDKLRLASELPPRSSSAPPDRDSTWEHLESDIDERVPVKCLRVVLPDLASLFSYVPNGNEGG